MPVREWSRNSRERDEMLTPTPPCANRGQGEGSSGRCQGKVEQVSTHSRDSGKVHCGLSQLPLHGQYTVNIQSIHGQYTVNIRSIHGQYTVGHMRSGCNQRTAFGAFSFSSSLLPPQPIVTPGRQESCTGNPHVHTDTITHRHAQTCVHTDMRAHRHACTQTWTLLRTRKAWDKQ